MTQTELARRAGVTQSVISAYESGHRQPALPTLAALVEATGHELVVSTRPLPRRLRELTGPLGQLVRRRRRALVETAARHGLVDLQLFGSVARGEESADSDVDLLARIPPDLGLFGLARARGDLQAVLGSRVDLVPSQHLKPAVRDQVERDAIAL